MDEGTYMEEREAVWTGLAKAIMSGLTVAQIQRLLEIKRRRYIRYQKASVANGRSDG